MSPTLPLVGLKCSSQSVSSKSSPTKVATRLLLPGAGWSSSSSSSSSSATRGLQHRLLIDFAASRSPASQ
ncbi:unnamed protein product [Jaminaea pallidilutea]